MLRLTQWKIPKTFCRAQLPLKRLLEHACLLLAGLLPIFVIANDSEEHDNRDQDEITPADPMEKVGAIAAVWPIAASGESGVGMAAFSSRWLVGWSREKQPAQLYSLAYQLNGRNHCFVSILRPTTLSAHVRLYPTAAGASA